MLCNQRLLTTIKAFIQQDESLDRFMAITGGLDASCVTTHPLDKRLYRQEGIK
jgi:hypothetical protein